MSVRTAPGRSARRPAVTTAAVASALCALLAWPEARAEPQWWEVNDPAPGPVAAVGTASRGCLAGGEALPLSGPGWEVMRPSRGRYFGHPRLVAFVEAFARAVQAEGLPRLLVGDLAQPRGGPMASGHASHQTGLDVDVWFRPAPDAPLSDGDREALAAVSMVAADGRSVAADAWGDAPATMLRTAAAFAEVDRMFVNAAIKAELCATTAVDDRAWLRKLRPWWGHDHHFHVRLGCAADDRSCEAQPPLPDGDGCDESLQWWFSADAAAELAKRGKEPPRRLGLDDLPARCRIILGAGRR
jgi:penicillin-insensitive murein endopeptidase